MTPQEKPYLILFNTTYPNGSSRCVNLPRLKGLDSMNGSTPMEAVKRIMRLLQIDEKTPIRVMKFSYCMIQIYLYMKILECLRLVKDSD